MLGVGRQSRISMQISKWWRCKVWFQTLGACLCCFLTKGEARITLASLKNTYSIFSSCRSTFQIWLPKQLFFLGRTLKITEVLSLGNTKDIHYEERQAFVALAVSFIDGYVCTWKIIKRRQHNFVFGFGYLIFGRLMQYTSRAGL